MRRNRRAGRTGWSRLHEPAPPPSAPLDDVEQTSKDLLLALIGDSGSVTPFNHGALAPSTLSLHDHAKAGLDGGVRAPHLREDGPGTEPSGLLVRDINIHQVLCSPYSLI